MISNGATAACAAPCCWQGCLPGKHPLSLQSAAWASMLCLAMLALLWMGHLCKEVLLAADQGIRASGTIAPKSRHCGTAPVSSHQNSQHF
eukprot:1158587-Pelagomonas_calceolata.AAC.5